MILATKKYIICYLSLCDAPPILYFRDKLLYHLTCEMRILSKNATVAEKIRFYRTKRDMHGHMLAKLVGLSRYAIIYYENNQTEPLLEDLKKIATALGIEADMLYDDYYRFLDYPYSEKIKEIRKEHGLYQRQLAEILGADRRTIERWERSRTHVSRKTWNRLKDLGLL